MIPAMKTGNIIEYIDRQRIVCAVVLEINNQRLRLLTEGNREVKLPAARVLHSGQNGLDLAAGRDALVAMLRQKAARRKALKEKVSVRDLWEVLNTEQELIDLDTMTAFCFPDTPTDDHAAAVLRAFFDNRCYFKFQPDGFFPYTEAQVEKMRKEAREAERRTRLIEEGGPWLKGAVERNFSETPSDEVIEILRSLYLYGKESPCYGIGRAILARAKLADSEDLFPVLVGLGIFEVDENVDLIRLEIPAAFSPKVDAHTEKLVQQADRSGGDAFRKDLTDLPVMTIDGQATLDFDDALSVEMDGKHIRLGVHIADVGELIRRGDPVDRTALNRASSIYMPDSRIPMLPPMLAEGLCSLKAGQSRPAITLFVELTPAAEVLDFTVLASRIRVGSQLTYFDVNQMAEENENIRLLHRLASGFRRRRLDAGALQISLPEIHVWIDRDAQVRVNQVNRESPGRMLVTELMIMANWLTARFLKENRQPAVFRSQPAPRERLLKGEEGSLFQNWMQRKLLSRFVLGTGAEPHAGLGLDAYVTATSPIRKYYDLATQRQVRALLGLETPYTADEIETLIQELQEPMARVGRVQFRRHRYWMLKSLETRIGEKAEAIVLYKKRSSYQILLTDTLIECDLPASRGLTLKPEDLVQVTFQRVDARKDVLNVYLG